MASEGRGDHPFTVEIHGSRVDQRDRDGRDLQPAKHDRDVRQLHWGGGTPGFLSLQQTQHLMEKIAQLGPEFEAVPVSALTGDNLERLLELIVARLPSGLPQFPDDQLTDKSMRFISAEIIREKLTLNLRQEVPYGVSVQIERYIEDPLAEELQINYYHIYHLMRRDQTYFGGLIKWIG